MALVCTEYFGADGVSVGEIHDVTFAWISLHDIDFITRVQDDGTIDTFDVFEQVKSEPKEPKKSKKLKKPKPEPIE